MSASQDKLKTLVITGGGTGGHIYPGLAVAQAVEAASPGTRIVFIGASGGMEESIFPRFKYEHYFIRIGRLHSSVGRLQQIKTLLLMPLSLLHAAVLFLKVRPNTVLGVGGFASGPFLLISWLFGANTYLWEANAFPGLTNRWLSRWSRATFVVFEEAKRFLKGKKVIFSGMPVRREFFDVHSGEVSRRFRVLVFGGSQGARFINEKILDIVKNHPQWLDEVELVHQIGSRDFQRLRAEYGALADKARVMEYIHDMPAEIKNADLVVCRSGASTVAEVVSCRKPAIFIPLPTAADNHQYHNARVVEQKGGAVVREQKDVTAENLLEDIQQLKNNREKLRQMSSRLSEFDFSRAADTIARALIEGV